MGEDLTPNPDKIVMPLIDLANIACGGHAGNNKTMQETVKLALAHNTLISAHPSYEDPANFGRVSLKLSAEKLSQSIIKQVTALHFIVEKQGGKIQYIKPHGALYLDIMNQPKLFKQFCLISQQLNQQLKLDLTLIIQQGVNQLLYQQIAVQHNTKLLLESFADRRYVQQGKLAPRSEPNAVYNDVDTILRQVQNFSKNTNLNQTLCFHSDNKASVQALKETLKSK